MGAPPKLTLVDKLSYGVGSTALGVSGIGLSSGLLTFFMNQVIGIPALWVGTALLATLAVDAIFDPLVGQWSDGAHTRLGRRHPFMFASAPLALAACLLFWRPPAALGTAATFAYMMAMLLLLRLAVSLYEIPSSGLAPELTDDYHERTTLFGYRWLFIIVGGLVMNAILYLWFLRPQNGGLLHVTGYAQWGVLAAVVIAVSIGASCLGTLSRIPYLSRPPAQRVGRREALRQVVATVTNPSLLAVMISGLMGGVTTGLNSTLSNYFYIYLWGMTNAQISAITFAAGLGSVVAVGLASAVSRRFGKKRSMITLFYLSVFIGAVPLSLKLLGLAPPNGSLATTALLTADLFLAVTLGIMGLVIISSMIADVVEDAAVKTGKRSEGLLFAANGLLPKLTAGAGAFLGSLLIALVGLSGKLGAGVAPRPEVMRHLAMAYLPFSLVLSTGSLIAISFYRIDEAAHRRNVDALRDSSGH
jgi:glycoside/pentoside/hexuronide:cation symporter, GPH family